MTRSKRAIATRSAWGVADQFMSALTNVIISFAIASPESAENFGLFSVVFVLFNVVQILTRSLVSTPLTIVHSASDPLTRRNAVSASLAAAAIVGAVAALGFAVVGFLVGGLLGQLFLIGAAGMIGLLVHDGLRMGFMTEGRPKVAFFADGLWFGGVVVAVVVLVSVERNSAPWLFAAWAAAGCLASLGVMLWDRVPMGGIRSGWAWLVAHRQLSRGLVVDWVSSALLSQAGVLMIGVIATIDELGGYRAAAVLLGPYVTFRWGARFAATPEAVRLAAEGPRSLMRFVAAFALVVPTVGLIATLGVHVGLWDAAGRALVGESWAVAKSVLLPFGLAHSAIGFVEAAVVALSAVKATDTLGRTRIVTGMLSLGATLAGAAVNGAVGAAWGLGGMTVLTLGPWWYVTRRAVVNAEP